jgi:hypothetical protein
MLRAMCGIAGQRRPGDPRPPVRAAALLSAGLLSAALFPRPAQAQATPAPVPTRTATRAPEALDEPGALRLARAAFEYRDFARVLALLEPWLRPPRIVDRERRRDANRLVGVSAHVLGDVRRAEDAFAQALLADPSVELDPFVVPPPVIETFERVRASMGAVLRAEPTPPRGAPRASDGLAPRFVAWSPLGLGHFAALDAPVSGSLWLALQLGGLATNVTAFWIARGYAGTDGYLADPGDRAALDRANVALGVGAAVFFVGWLGSAIHGDALWTERRDARPEPAALDGRP